MVLIFRKFPRTPRQNKWSRRKNPGPVSYPAKNAVRHKAAPR